MTGYNNILIATDGSARAQRAVESGIKMAASMNARVYAVYIIHTFPAISVVLSSKDWNPPTQILTEVGKEATQYVKGLGDANNVEVIPIISQGDPSNRVLEIAGEKDIDLIVLGALGVSGVDRFLLGSVADKVIRNAKIPVLVVH